MGRWRPISLITLLPSTKIMPKNYYVRKAIRALSPLDNFEGIIVQSLGDRGWPFSVGTEWAPGLCLLPCFDHSEQDAVRKFGGKMWDRVCGIMWVEVRHTGVVPSHKKLCFTSAHPRLPEQEVTLMLSCKCSALQPSEGHYKEGPWRPSLHPSPLCAPYGHTHDQITQSLPLGICTLQKSNTGCSGDVGTRLPTHVLY